MKTALAFKTAAHLISSRGAKFNTQHTNNRKQTCVKKDDQLTARTVTMAAMMARSRTEGKTQLAKDKNSL